MNLHKKIGKKAEEKVAQFLIEKNYKIVERNFYCRFGEIDIIAVKDGVFHFVEVKSGRNFEPIYNLTSKKLKKIIKTIDFYIEKSELNAPYQIDAITLKNGKIEIIENITF